MCKFRTVWKPQMCEWIIFRISIIIIIIIIQHNEL